MPRESQYTDAYLQGNAKRGWTKGITPGTFITYNVRGSARRYSDRYIAALINSVANRDGVKSGQSACNGTAYYPAGVREQWLASQQPRPTSERERLTAAVRVLLPMVPFTPPSALRLVAKAFRQTLEKGGY